jgi:predicted CXXCH cytochrome family protein
VRSIVFAWVVLVGLWASAQTQDVLGSHNLSTSVGGRNSAACLYCHAPHSGLGNGPLWSHQLSAKVYPNLYTSPTLQNVPDQPVLGDNSSLCLSCHDGTVAPGLTVPYGQITTSQMSRGLLPNLENSHPFSLRLPIKDAAHLVPTIAAGGTTGDTTGAVKLINGNIECATCHNPHNQKIDIRSPKFLVRDNTRGALCLSCHTTQGRTVNSRTNPLTTWMDSIHSTSGAAVSPASQIGGYNTVAEFACQSCHQTHNAGGGRGLLRNVSTPTAGVDTNSQSCMTCHSNASTLVVPILDVFAAYQTRGSHPFPSGTNLHTTTEPAVLVQNRHAGCADCHNPHAAKEVTIFNAAPEIRPSQNAVAGVAADGSPLIGPAVNQYETCLRCHGPGSGKQSLPDVFGYLPSRAVFAGDPLNLIPQFGLSAVSSHPVMRDATNAQQFSLRPSMLNIAGTGPSREMGTRIFCSDCHNSENNREFGGTGPNGPHGSVNNHILERRYEASQVTPGTFPNGGPGSLIANLAPNPALTPGQGNPYNLCAKCHDLTNLITDQSFRRHSVHVNKGISCSVCHSAHGVPSGSAGTSGERLVNFDVNVVAPYAGVLSYSQAGQTCTLTCHMMDHKPDGTVTPSQSIAVP